MVSLQKTIALRSNICNMYKTCCSYFRIVQLMQALSSHCHHLLASTEPVDRAFACQAKVGMHSEKAMCSGSLQPNNMSSTSFRDYVFFMLVKRSATLYAALTMLS